MSYNDWKIEAISNLYIILVFFWIICEQIWVIGSYSIQFKSTCTMKLRYSQFNLRIVSWWHSQAFYIISANQSLSLARCFKPTELQMEWLGFCHIFCHITWASHIHTTRQECHLVPSIKYNHIVWLCTRPRNISGNFTPSRCGSNTLIFCVGEKERSDLEYNFT